MMDIMIDINCNLHSKGKILCRTSCLSCVTYIGWVVQHGDIIISCLGGMCLSISRAQLAPRLFSLYTKTQHLLNQSF